MLVHHFLVCLLLTLDSDHQLITTQLMRGTQYMILGPIVPQIEDEVSEE